MNFVRTGVSNTRFRYKAFTKTTNVFYIRSRKESTLKGRPKGVLLDSTEKFQEKDPVEVSGLAKDLSKHINEINSSLRVNDIGNVDRSVRGPLKVDGCTKQRLGTQSNTTKEDSLILENKQGATTGYVSEHDHNDKGNHTHVHTHGHTHGHGHAHDHSHGLGENIDLLVSLKDHRDGIRVTLLGMFCNIFLFVLKGIGGICYPFLLYFFGFDGGFCVCIISIYNHNVNILGDLVAYFTFKKSRKSPDSKHPLGYGRYEAAGTFFVSSFLVAAGVGIGSHSIEQVMVFLPEISTAIGSLQGAFDSKNALAAAKEILQATPNLPALHENSLVHMHSHEVIPNQPIGGTAMAIAGFSFALNEVLFRVTKKIGIRLSSDVLVANAWHHRGDAWSSLITLVAVTGSALGVPILDPIGGLIVSVTLAKSGVVMAKDSFNELVDNSSRPEVQVKLNEIISHIKEHDSRIHDLVNPYCRKSGPFNHIFITLVLKSDTKLSDFKVVERFVKNEIRTSIPNTQCVFVSVDIH
ncbi:Metal tolerance protein C1 [Zancudomyces culisetae]|uniref:Metal tolerance protein C1 n=1 Tax=Zancudomyces culisetae TaxID=1213189 RepID=A0A1R1PXI2_ZANCU|nr:Metal tolerance protein C1 [Zancudomyces culisetae]|eukprot:OMH85649.1 Metal tolerance protein C1 [Zancudomyces culisetae]